MKAILITLVVLSGISLSHAQSYTANLDSFQEGPPHNTPGFGSADFTLSGTTFSVDAGTGLYADLLGGATSVGLQFAGGTNVFTVFLFNLDTPGNTSGTFSGAGTLTPILITDLQNGSLSINIADSVFPSGEIRGQIEPAPEPATLALMGAGLVGLLAVRRRKV